MAAKKKNPKKGKKQYRWVTVNIGVRMPAEVKEKIEAWLEANQKTLEPKKDGKPWTVGDIATSYAARGLQSEYAAIMKEGKTTESGIEIVEQERLILLPGEVTRGKGKSMLFGADGRPL